ncbi:MAG: TspO/MBR family protein [Rhodospirillaceae bacterium]
MPPHIDRLSPKRSVAIQGGALVMFLVLTAVVATLGGMATYAGMDGWYASLAKPPLNPPDWVFGPVWTALYAMMAVAAWRIWRQPAPQVPGAPSRARALGLWGGQLALNLLWPVLFFALKSPLAALGALVVQAIVLAAATWDFGVRDRMAGLLMVPVLLWVTFAGYLNGGVVVVN